MEQAIQYADQVARGEIPAGKWLAAAARRYLSDLERSDLIMDWDELEKMRAFFAELKLINDYSDAPFVLPPWQLWNLSNLWCWRYADDGRRRVTSAVLQVGRGNGKTTLMAGLCLYDLCSGPGRRVYAIANREEQAHILVDAAKLMVRRMTATDATVRQYTVERREHDCVLSALPARASSLDGLTPSLYIADEAAEYRDRFLSKLTSAIAKRREALGVIISTPADNPDGLYGEKIEHAHAVLRGDIEDDSTVAMLYGIDDDDELDDESAWIKANPGMQHGQPDVKSIRRRYNETKTTPLGRAEFARYHACRMTEQRGGWLDMSFYPAPTEIDWEALRGRVAWAGLDLSKTLDLTALVVAVPLDNGTVALRGHYWWPAGNAAQREIDYRLPVRTWAAKGFLTLTPGHQIPYESVLEKLAQLRDEFSLQAVAFDPYGSKYFAETALSARYGIPMLQYSQGIQNVAPSCQLWQQYWVAKQLVIGEDPVMRNACRTAIALRDTNGNIRIDKRVSKSVIDPLAAALMAVHAWGGETQSVYANL